MTGEKADSFRGASAGGPGDDVERPNRAYLWPIVAIVVILVVMVTSAVAGFVYIERERSHAGAIVTELEQIRNYRYGVTNQMESARGYATTGNTALLKTFFGASDMVSENVQALRRLAAKSPGRSQADPLRIARQLDGLWLRSIGLARRGARVEADALLNSPEAVEALARIRSQLGRYETEARERHAEHDRRLGFAWHLVIGIQIVGGCLSIAGLAASYRHVSRDARRRRQAMRQAEILFHMADVLQSASGQEDANAVLGATARRLLPHLSGALYLFSSARDRLVLSTAWNEHDDDIAPPNILASECWAVKRGKVQANSRSGDALRCEHHLSDGAAIEVPMVARGEVHGLIRFSANGPAQEQELAEAATLISALTDAVSLALSNIALRDKLRSQALKDPLTGLYNRRYMEDSLQRFVSLSQRSGTPASVVLIDLDHFKKLNDEHGHLIGDTILRAVADTVSGTLRESDIACRYGGEELLIILPDCALADAVYKAEVIRARVETLSNVHGVRVTASLGVASSPENSNTVQDLILQADTALYEAKRGGRNCVQAAAARPNSLELSVAA
ncbi:diguanylate cyclase [Allosphingosinicella deserti]|uniref:diguanylate cyclase n=1 Tax=Allosphingosinicella deserti TaxID=2116704 RepID=A0A2P7QY81_9SPHN|nr:diguanylate cyclase [Sphingomonas deserti]PSJ42924.1 GGDEF domain-containing protein [Sphingomonas deserti]